MDFVFGKKKNPQAVQELVDVLSGLALEGSLYIGYPIFDVNEDALLTDALMVSREHGVVIFDLTNAAEQDCEVIEEYQDDLHRGLVKRLLSEKGLVYKRDLTVTVNVLTFRQDPLDDIEYCTPETIEKQIRQYPSITEEQFKLINASIQKTSVLKPSKKRTKVKSTDSLGSKIKTIEKEIANLDRWQKKAAIESPDKPQRIRGLAGSGKTIILSIKAAYLHAYNPNLTIAVTFQTRSLYQQLERLTSKFYFENTQEEIDPDYLKIRHAWGSTSDPGIYSEICAALGIDPLNFVQAKQKYSRETAFEGACQEALDVAEKSSFEPLYDYILIDEAQDFPVSFFKLIYKFVRYPHRVVWAYDELQNLGNFTMLPPEDLFGRAADGSALVSLEDNGPDSPKQDIMLPICYRNPPWTLTMALALGLGIYRDEGPIRMFPDPKFWKNIGFEPVSGQLALGQNISLQRSASRTPPYFHELIDPETAIIHKSFNDKEQQGAWIAKQIQKNIQEDELEESDILIVFPDAYTLASESAHVVFQLRSLGISCHVVGKNSSQDVVFVDGSVAITHIHRAKGNEAPMVYAANAHYCYTGFDLGKKRNSLFTAITRTKAWVRITGVGFNMELLSREIEKVYENNFTLRFKYPTTKQLEALENAYKDKSPDEVQELNQGFGQIKRIRRALKNGEISIDDVPADIRDMFE
ncbi:DEAD/DEAH box helicase [Pseudomonas oryzihabitans]|uniref:DEAD/DEAH box helicase n=1 Tax=Pseudomonas oryzihabitans TaxID=47885 RepID=UPI001238933C|nr:ATP-binding domain-containing protein [Pseudomonas oryzihabitans]QEU02744.1 AAA family ATPase [Pseudomonas oryzihabitans]